MQSSMKETWTIDEEETQRFYTLKKTASKEDRFKCTIPITVTYPDCPTGAHHIHFAEELGTAAVSQLSSPEDYRSMSVQQVLWNMKEYVLIYERYILYEFEQGIKVNAILGTAKCGRHRLRRQK